ncbi:GNAT family N-acetyltransferase [Methylomonas sp. MED-D]|nr:GNAT family N-acetyltransferase [Methylomonas sp. MV1]MDT4332229.1 GNAT family N-acetyltransferase [Methylomonas sp. MV1]
MTLQVRAYGEADAEDWDSFCDDSLQSTLLHTRRFLSYHGSRFVDQSLIIYDEHGWLGLLPAALQPDDEACVVSHPGATYGGIVQQGQLRGERMIEALRTCCRYYRSQCKQRLLYKAVPAFYHRQPAQDDLYALFRLNAHRYRCDLSSSIDLTTPRGRISERRRRSLNKARKNQIGLSGDMALLGEFWQVLTENLARKHGTGPVHSLSEITMLAERFPDQIQIVCGTHQDQVVAGVLLFITATCIHTQYIAANDIGYQFSALDAVFDFCITKAVSDGKRWLDFGICNEQAGKVLNEGLYKFKTEFGGGGTVHEFFEIPLTGEENVD